MSRFHYTERIGSEMSEVKRIFVEKRKGFDVEAVNLLADLKQNLGIKNAEAVRIINRYDISGLDGESFEKAKNTILSETNADTVYDEKISIGDEFKVFAMEYLPGQYDQRADSAAQCVQLLTQGERPQVVTAKVIAVSGNISDTDFKKIKDYLINPVESRIASFEKPESLDMKANVPDNVAVIKGFTVWNDEEMEKYYSSMGFAMTLSDLSSAVIISEMKNIVTQQLQSFVLSTHIGQTIAVIQPSSQDLRRLRLKKVHCLRLSRMLLKNTIQLVMKFMARIQREMYPLWIWLSLE